MIRKNIFFTKNQINAIEEEARKRGITFSEMLRRILDSYFDNDSISKK